MSCSVPVFDETYYQTVYRNYKRQNPARKLRFYRWLLTRHLTQAGPPIVLDVGCAFGDFLRGLPGEWQRYGIDASEYAIEQGKANSPEIHLAAATLEDNPFAGPFDAITSFDVIEHIPDIDAVWQTMEWLLKPGGIFLFVVPVYDGPLGWLVHALDKDPTHVHKTGRAVWLSWAGASFTVLEWWGLYRYLTPFGIYAHFSTRIFRRTSPAIAVIARKALK